MEKMRLAALVAMAVMVSQPAWAARPKIGALAPEFSMKDADGKLVSLADYRGKYIVLEFMETACPFVMKYYETNTVQKLQKEFASKGVVWLTVDAANEQHAMYTPPPVLKKWLNGKRASPTRIIPDTRSQLSVKYAATNTPAVYVVDPAGKLVYYAGMDNGKTSDLNEVLNPKPGYINYLRTALSESLAGKPVSKPTAPAYGCAIHYYKAPYES